MQQTENFKKYITAFEKKLGGIVTGDISPSPYCIKYLTHLLLHQKYYLEIYADVLNKLMQHSFKSKDDTLLVDYGSGNGLLGIFAKYCGFKKVFLNDIDANFINASRQLANQLDVKPDGFFTSDISMAKASLKNNAPDAIVGTDVIEHIYNLDTFFATLRQINPSMVSVFTTASNPDNYFKVKALKQMQIKDELEGGKPGDSILYGEHPLEPFLKIREQIIRWRQHDLPDQVVMKLARATRGLNKEDIINAVDDYHLSGKLPDAPAHETNTCNPIDGSWTERILSLTEYKLLYKSAGFTAKFYNGFFNAKEGGPGGFIKQMLNAGVAILGKRIAPYIIIVGNEAKNLDNLPVKG